MTAYLCRKFGDLRVRQCLWYYHQPNGNAGDKVALQMIQSAHNNNSRVYATSEAHQRELIIMSLCL